MKPLSNLERFAARLRGNMVLSVSAGPTKALPSNEDEFNRLALELFALQFDHNPVYRRISEQQGISPRSIVHWSDIPAVPAAAFKELELSCIPASERTTVFFSSGTTEHRQSRHFHNKESLKVYEASLLTWFGVHLWEGGQVAAADTTFARARVGRIRPNLSCSDVGPAEARKQKARRRRDAGAPIGEEGPVRGLALTPPQAQAPHSSLVHMFETLGRMLSFTRFAFTGRATDDGGWAVDCPATIEFLREAVDAKEPVMLLGTAFLYVHLHDYLAKGKLTLRLPAGSRVLETGGYKGRSRALPKAELHSLITALLGVPPSHIVCEYGMSELSSQAYDRQATIDGDLDSGRTSALSRRFRFPPWVRIQIVSPETGREVEDGQAGLIRVFDLANVYSVLAVQTEDLAVRRGDRFELIGRAALSEPRGCSLMAC
jgi:hypothetical protein